MTDEHKDDHFKRRTDTPSANAATTDEKKQDERKKSDDFTIRLRKHRIDCIEIRRNCIEIRRNNARS